MCSPDSCFMRFCFLFFVFFACSAGIDSFLCAGRLFIRQDNIGLQEMIDDSLQPVRGAEIFKTKKIFMMAPYNTGEILIGTNSEGFYLYNGTRVIPFPTEVDDYLKQNSLYHGIRLSSGDYALATLRGGLVIMDPRGRLKYTWNKTSGLLDDSVYYVFEDSQENLWLCLSKGISRIENASPLSIHDERSGLAGILMTVVFLEKVSGRRRHIDTVGRRLLGYILFKISRYSSLLKPAVLRLFFMISTSISLYSGMTTGLLQLGHVKI